MTPDAPAGNPFPVEAVATFGASIVTCDALAYMIDVREELSRYLTAHPRTDARFGGAIGLRGGHGAGKTHVLGWIAETAKNTKAIRSTVLYAKCDSSKVFDLYQQLMQQLDRPQVIELIQLALLNLARAKVRSAKATESLADRLGTAGGLQELQAEQNLDLEQMRQQLLGELQTTAGSAEMVRVVLDIPSGTRGADAYRWLAGNEVDDLAMIGVSYVLRALPREGAVDADTSAITALEVIAALHRIAGVPMFVLVDQLEVLLRPPAGQGLETLGSLIKTFVERLARQCAMLFIAGTPEAWRKLPPDVPARFRRREQVVVGGLSLDEARIFVSAFTKAKGPAFTKHAIETIHQLSGGNPREILRISHHAFERIQGDLSRADDRILIESARQSGSLADRVKLVLFTADAVFQEFGAVARELAVAEDLVVDRVLRDKAGEVIAAIVILKATDPLDEIDSARRLQGIRQYAREQWKRAELLVVTVGYSSTEVRDLLGSDTVPIAFAEKTFEGELRARLVSPVKKREESAPPVSQSPARPDPQVVKSLADIAERLAKLEQRRSAEAATVQRRFVDEVSALARPQTEELKLSSRREVLHALESLQTALFATAPESKQRLVRSILVANEAYLSNPMLDDLGELYLDAVAAQRLESDLNAELLFAREDLIRGMRDSLRRPTGLRSVAGYSRRTAIGMLALFVAFIATGIISSAAAAGEKYGYGRILFLPFPRDFISFLPFACLGSLFVWTDLSLAVWYLDRSRIQRYRSRIELLRERVRRQQPESSLETRYPQARGGQST